MRGIGVKLPLIFPIDFLKSRGRLEYNCFAPPMLPLKLNAGFYLWSYSSFSSEESDSELDFESLPSYPISISSTSSMKQSLENLGGSNFFSSVGLWRQSDWNSLLIYCFSSIFSVRVKTLAPDFLLLSDELDFISFSRTYSLMAFLR